MKSKFLFSTILFITVISFNVKAQYSMISDFTDNNIFSGANPQSDQNLITIGSYMYGTTTSGGIYGDGVVFKINIIDNTYTKILDFIGAINGSSPCGSLISDGAFLYGMTNYGGANGLGVVYKINIIDNTYTKLLDFSGANNGGTPYGSLISDGTFLYGITQNGGLNEMGVVFKIKISDNTYTKLLDFDSTTNGRNPMGSLITDGTYLYGMTRVGGANNMGLVFKINISNNIFIKIFDFDGTVNGSYPWGTLASDGVFLYGMTNQGGVNELGVVFKIKISDNTCSKILDFAGINNGSNPSGSLVIDDGFLYGMAYNGGVNDKGVAFKININENTYTKILDFEGTINGGNPTGSFISDGSYLYGMTQNGGTDDKGVIFKIKISNNSYTKIIDFTNARNGGHPTASLVSDGTYLYGMTYYGGANDKGVVFKINISNNIYTKILDFNGTTNGSAPYGSLILDENFLYGMTSNGGINDKGTIFKIKIGDNTYMKILDFNGTNNGSYPWGTLMSDGSYLYGMTLYGGLYNQGVLFKVKISDNTYTKILNFNGLTNGSTPYGALISDGTYLYGTTSGGNSSNYDVLFKLKIIDNSYTKILDFDGANYGATPFGSLISDGNFLYGMTSTGGLNDKGVVFKLKISDNTYTKLFNFDGATSGATPYGSLVSDGAFLYGMTSLGGTNDIGVLFKIKISDNTYTKLLDFEGVTNGSSPVYTQLLLQNGFLYGTTNEGGIANAGTIFKYQLSTTNIPEFNIRPTKIISVYPNPSNGLFNIEIPSSCDATISDMAGRVIRTEKLVNIQNNLDLSTYAKGVYILELRNYSKVVNYKLIVK